MNGEVYKTGDELICLPGFNTSDHGDKRGGAGYKKGKIIVVQDCNTEDKDPDDVIYWPTKGDCGIYGQALALHKSDKVVNTYEIF